MSKNMGLTDTLEAIKDGTQGDEITFGDLVEALDHRGFGPLLIGPALIATLPTGAIPGIPALCAVFIILIAGQIVIGRTSPWLPKKLKQISFSREEYKKGLKKAEPYTKWIEQFFHERFAFLTQEPAQKVIAVLCIILSIAIIIIGFIPFAALLPSSAILLFGLGLSIRDGLLTAIGFVFVGVTFAAIPFLIGG